MDNNFKGIIITNSNNILSEEEILIYILNVCDIKNILNLEISSDYFSNSNIVGEYNVNVKKENESFSFLIVVNDNKEIKNNINYDLMFSLILFVMILFIFIIIFIQKINFKIKEKNFFKNENGE